MSTLHGIYAIVDPVQSPATLDYLEALLDGGVRLVQYREKRGVDRALVREMQARCVSVDALLIVNDDVDAALLAGGVHLGQEDLALTSLAQVRSRLGARIIGVSAATPQAARRAQLEGADYVGAGPYRATRSKRTSREPLGAAGLRSVVESVELPVAAIGGIELDDLGEVIAAGAHMAAVISALAGAEDPRAAAQAMVTRWSAR